MNTMMEEVTEKKESRKNFEMPSIILIRIGNERIVLDFSILIICFFGLVVVSRAFLSARRFLASILFAAL